MQPFGAKKKEVARRALRALVPYPAVLVPNQFGGFDVFFPNFTKAASGGVNLKLALEDARRELNYQLYKALRLGGDMPVPSLPDGLLPDEEEIAGTRVVVIEPDRDEILRRLGLNKLRSRMSPSGQKYTP